MVGLWCDTILSKVNQAQKRQIPHDLLYVKAKRIDFIEIESRLIGRGEVGKTLAGKYSVPVM